ncbi:hypothetical protein AMAG_14499 [Allomyces macrogynus ATCC 38327]|uniref:DOPA 4,5-dioxygenase n=1 Tax=Allomyces macrogynus (strain ATCC 38327) TaxID=578462 RepID=A0A0L0T6D6_ALLM3|nr:hypothetical protein AMAG_14499 [Allomyces macrogynus ATCC 38327]|eukprot:KNE70358.1 hypothetical protein AMAG_14499 [Allomyces macrogynus ATCC 38327]
MSNTASAAERAPSTVAWPHPITSYDVHIYWLPSSKQQYLEAMALKERAAELFPHLWHGKMWDRPIGPHPYNMFEIDIHRADDFGPFVAWLVLNHGSLSVLIHPQTGNDVKDHTEHALWLGQKVPLDVGMLEQIDQRREQERQLAEATAKVSVADDAPSTD